MVNILFPEYLVVLYGNVIIKHVFHPVDIHLLPNLHFLQYYIDILKF